LSSSLKVTQALQWSPWVFQYLQPGPHPSCSALLCSARELLPPPLNSGELPRPPPAPAPLASATSTSSASPPAACQALVAISRAATPLPCSPRPPRRRRHPAPPCRAPVLLRAYKALQHLVSNPFRLFPELTSPPVIFFLASPPSKLRRRSASPSVASSRASHPRSRPPSAPQLLPNTHRIGQFLVPPPETSAREHVGVLPPPPFGLAVDSSIPSLPFPISCSTSATSPS
jgi:hypothetical protein